MKRALALLSGWSACATPRSDRVAPPFPTVPAPTLPTDTGIPPVDWPDVDVPVPGEALFDHAPGDALVITIRPDDDLELDRWMRAEVTVDGFGTRTARVRLKGHGSYDKDKPSYKIDLDPFHEGASIDGLHALVLNNMVLDPSGVREVVAYEAYRRAGVPAPRTRPARVTAGGSFRGVYMAMDEVDEGFLERVYPSDHDGSLYEVSDADFTPAGAWLIDHEAGPDRRELLVGLAVALEAQPVDLRDAVAPYLDLDQVLTYLGTSAVIGQFDAYPYSSPGDDVYLYVPADDPRIRFLPHGTDETFADPNRPVDYVFGLLARRCLADRACEDDFEAAVWEALALVEQTDLGEVARAAARDLDGLPVTENTDIVDVADVLAGQEAVQAFIATRREQLLAMPGLEAP